MLKEKGQNYNGAKYSKTHLKVTSEAEKYEEEKWSQNLQYNNTVTHLSDGQ